MSGKLNLMQPLGSRGGSLSAAGAVDEVSCGVRRLGANAGPVGDALEVDVQLSVVATRTGGVVAEDFVVATVAAVAGFCHHDAVDRIVGGAVALESDFKRHVGVF